MFMLSNHKKTFDSIIYGIRSILSVLDEDACRSPDPEPWFSNFLFNKLHIVAYAVGRVLQVNIDCTK